VGACEELLLAVRVVLVALLLVGTVEGAGEEPAIRGGLVEDDGIFLVDCSYPSSPVGIDYILSGAS